MLLAGVLTAPALAEDGVVYQWTDADGIVRYTHDSDRIPRGERDSVVRLEPGMPATDPLERAEPMGTIPSMLGGPIPEGATVDPDEPSLTTTAPTPAPAPRTDDESPIGQPIPAPEAAGSAPALESPAAGPAPADGGEQGAVVLPGWWGAPEPYAPEPPGQEPAVDGPDRLLAQLQTDPRTDPGETLPASDDLDGRIRSLEAEVSRDEGRLKDMIADSHADAVPNLQNSPELREIAGRLPDLQAELVALKRERASRQAP
jgi:hypothetical protein